MIIEDAFEFSNTTTSAAIAKFISEYRSSIYDAWVAAIRSKSTRGGTHILAILQSEFESDTDLLTILSYTLTGQIHAETSRLNGLVEKVRTKEYSVSELFYEIFSLQDAFEATFTELGSPGNFEIVDNLKMTRRVLGRIFSAVLEQTSWMYEHVTESGKRGFCQMDRGGRITYCNAEMERIFEGCHVKGKRLDQLFEEESQQEYVRNSILHKNDNIPGSRELEILKKNSDTITVWAEIEPVIYENEHIASYAMFTDISPVAQRETAIFDSAPWCVVKVDSLGMITYANAEAMSLLGIDSFKGLKVMDFVDGEDREILSNALKRRQRGESGAYQIKVTPNGENNKPIEIDICGVPVTDAEDGLLGSIGIFHNRIIDNASHAINTHIAAKHDPQEMLEATAKIVHELIPHDLCIITRFSQRDDQNLVHANPFATIDPTGDMFWTKKWTPLSEAMVRWMRRDTVEPYILETFLQLDEWKDLADDPDIIKLLDLGYKSFIFRIVENNGALVSSFGLLSKNEQAFDDNACYMLEKLPIDQAMLMAQHQHEISEMAFRFELIKSITRASSLVDAANIFVQRLQKRYDWLHVSLFRVERYQKKLVLQSQKSSNDSMKLPRNYSQHIEEGLLAECLNSEKILNNGNVTSLSQYKAGIIAEDGTTPTHSELCCPIRANGEIHWILNIEDEKINAFSLQEEQSVKLACDEFGVLIERLTRHFSFQACFESTTDSVIITDGADNIVRANPSATDLLGDDNTEVIGHFESYFMDKEQAQTLLNASSHTPTEVTLQKGNNSQSVNMLMSCCELPEEIGEKVYISKDLSGLRRMEELEYQSQLSYEVAAQSQSSLSLAFTWLRRLRDDIDSCKDIPQLSDKIMRQLHKVQATYDRMARYDRKVGLASEQPIRLNLVLEINRMLDDFPVSDSTLISLPDKETVPYIMADPVHINFVLESIFSYLLRYASADRLIDVSIEQAEGQLTLKIDGCEPVREYTDKRDKRQRHDVFLERMYTDFTIGRQMIESRVARQNGKFIEPERSNGQIVFRLEFPINEMENVA